MDDDPQHPDESDARRAEALDDVEDDALSATDVDPTGNAVRNDAVERKEDAADRTRG
jgi:hypothetical protein